MQAAGAGGVPARLRGADRAAPRADPADGRARRQGPGEPADRNAACLKYYLLKIAAVSPPFLIAVSGPRAEY